MQSVDTIQPLIVPGIVMDGSRRCPQCGAVLAARFHHALFCSSDCRVSWNRDRMSEAGALTWSVAAMSEATGRLASMRAGDLTQALAVLGEAVWWITMVDDTLVRHHPSIYEKALAASGPAERFRTGQTLAGLAFVRDHIGDDADPAEVVDTGASRAAGTRVTNLRWRRIQGRPDASRSLDRSDPGYRAYDGQVAGRTIGETIGPAVTFLTLTGASAASAIDLNERATRKSASGPRP